MEHDHKVFTKKLFKEALQALACSPSEQISSTIPGYVPEELADNFLTFSESYIHDFKDDIAVDIIEEIKGLALTVEAIPESAFCDTNEKSLQNPVWQNIRDHASRILNLMDWPKIPPQPYEDLGEGIFQRK